MGQSTCWACGVRCPRQSPRHAAGWVSRWTRVGGSEPVLESYCHGCFSVWGWPPETVYTHPEHADARGAVAGPSPPRVYRAFPAGRRRRGLRGEPN